MVPQWFNMLSIVMLSLAGLCALVILADIVLGGHWQHMAIMNFVWPVTALFGSVIVLWLYLRYGRLATHRQMRIAKENDQPPPAKTQTPHFIMVTKGTLHCGAGCTLGDISAEFLALAVPALAIGFGFKWLFPDTEQGRMFAIWVLDYFFAFGLGVIFQYFTIKPMRNLSPAQGLIQAIKADALSLTAWQVGMYGLMAIAQFLVFSPLWQLYVKPDSFAFWFTMQLAMIAGFFTAWPVNAWLIRKGIKEKM